MRCSTTCREPGFIVRCRPSAVVCPLRIFAAILRSRREELVQEPIATCCTSIPAISLTGLTFPGLWGRAAIGSTSLKLSSMISSYSASASASREIHCSPRSCASMNAFVSWSLGNTLVVAPVSVPILVIVALSGTLRVLTPGPKYSSTLPTPPLTSILRRTSSITSFAETQSESFPVSFIPTILGYFILYGIPAMATATSRPPAPIANAPIPPAVGVWLSEPISVLPGQANRSKWS